MKDTVNFYFAMLLVAIASVAATLIIIHVANSNTLDETISGSEKSYSSLKESILEQ